MNIADYSKKFQACLDHFTDELKKLRTGRAHPSMLDGLTAEAYGVQMPLNQLATITTPEAQLLQISPFDLANIKAITSAIRDNVSLGLNPMDDGRVVRVPIPALNEDRRRDITKQVGVKLEDCMIAIRNIRHDAIKEADQALKDKSASEDDHSRFQKQIDDEMAALKARAEGLARAKEKEILTV